MNLDKVKNIVSEDSTVEKINKMLELEAKPTYKAKPNNKPSSLGSKCFRKIYYSYFRVEEDKPIDSKGLRIFETGNAYESMILNWLKKIGAYIPYRNKSNGEIPKHFITGEPDAQFPIKSPRWKITKGKIDNIALMGDEVWIYEIKSCNSGKFQSLTKPMDDHLVQIAIYFQTFNDLFLMGEYNHIPELQDKKKAVGVRIIYINKDTSEMKEFCLREPQLRGIILEVDKKITKVNSYIDSKTLPPATKDYCAYCSWQKKCKSGWNIE